MRKLIAACFVAFLALSQTAMAQLETKEMSWEQQQNSSWDMERAKSAFETCYQSAANQSELAECGFYKACELNMRDGMTTMGMSYCFKLEHQIWDKKLNVEYYALMKNAHLQDETRPDAFNYEQSSRAESLLKAQRAWVKFRDAECSDVYWAAHPGSIKNIRAARCKSVLTKARTIRLRTENQYEAWREWWYLD